MPAIFVHVSDIHFGQESGGKVHIHNDVKLQLIDDAAEVVRGLPGGAAHGILVTGDIAQGGKKEQYELAGAWLDSLAKAVGCETFRIQMVPGNHDLDRDKTSVGAGHVLDFIRNGGVDAYDKVILDPSDRASLFARFEAYGRFCEGYDCPLDVDGRHTSNMLVELAPGRAIRFVRLNSALLCTGKERDTNPELIIGAEQFLIPRGAPGEEIIVLVHHPLTWYRDRADFETYLRGRARILISGHEHRPCVGVENVEKGCDLMTLAAGATVPFASTVEYTYSYNVLVFDWNSDRDALSVTVHPRAWNPKRTCFEFDGKPLKDRDPCFILESPNFRRGVAAADKPAPTEEPITRTPAPPEPLIEMVAAAATAEGTFMPPEVDGYRSLLLRFFRDLTEGERLRILVSLDAVTADSDERMTQATERALFDLLVQQGKIDRLVTQVEECIKSRRGGDIG